MKVRVSAPTVKNELKTLTKSFCISELEVIKSQFTSMVEASSAVKDFMKDKHLIYSLIYDYGMGGYFNLRRGGKPNHMES
ncbi:hypothetical protein ACXZ1K_15910 [Pedobacter sp. PWIIR3]